ncbi:hypothetical protein E5F05_01840 (plasmid) [Deinococcus metallilatus]|uniref:Uncharacterized protein n=1 Tax=Deinococcus metallilatus TaxID=1211322 RepID=A0ABR6MY82_9DEIO|nr:hypothetical protein [Deinococcus metallilatus]MBB5296910.1 hypothetical protein [Deinococcus metallilatus]QBY06717.1 hypothetical protein E5F05_01840 [Deinococcus metallilatus]GMA15194.1 hypothetical protein GCM10025871_15250 [Deinococcus metallilatus]
MTSHPSAAFRVVHNSFNGLAGVRAGASPLPCPSALDVFVGQALLSEDAVGSVLTGNADPALQAALLDGGWTRLADDRWGKLHPLLSETPERLSERLGEIAAVLPEFTALAGALQSRLLRGAAGMKTTGSGEDLKWHFQSLERELWPTKVIHDDLPSFIVPVGVNWVQSVFGMEVARRPPPFGKWSPWSERHVQFLAARPDTRLQPGARLLWMQRATGRGKQTRLVGCSVLQEVQQGTVAALLRTLGHLPGMTRSEVQALAGDRDVRLTALVCIRPEVFTREVSRQETLRVGLKLGSGRTLSRLPLRISGAQFAELYAQGVRREKGGENIHPEGDRSSRRFTDSATNDSPTGH